VDTGALQRPECNNNNRERGSVRERVSWQTGVKGGSEGAVWRCGQREESPGTEGESAGSARGRERAGPQIGPGGCGREQDGQVWRGECRITQQEHEVRERKTG
jgi:hypothetical protein